MPDWTLGIAGAGNMGMQLALLFSSRNIPTVIWNHRIQPSFSSDFKRLVTIQSRLGRISREQIGAIMARVQYTNDIALLAHCDFAIETVKEDKETKSVVLRQLDSVAADAKVIATNTSTLSITELASFTGRPQRFIGAHFFNPPMSMRLVEVIKGDLTSDETVNCLLQMLSQLDKWGVVIPETPGFVVNRLLFPMINEAVFLLAEGTLDAKAIDKCMQMGVNHPMGPLELADLIGLDVCLSILETLLEKTGDGKYRPAPLLKEYVRAGRMGKKMGRGFHNYRKVD